MKSAYISVINDLVSDQRVQRVANLLVDHGMDVTCIGRRRKWSPSLEGKRFKLCRFRLIFNAGPLFYFFFNIRLFFKLIFVPQPALFIANDLDTLPAVFLAARIRRVRLIYDSHEFFTQVPELIERKRVQAIWKWIESLLLPRIEFAITVSYPIAEIYRRLYGTRFRVVRNFPERREALLKPPPTDGREVIIYQGALNMGRGLELMIHSMKYLDDVTLLIVGTGDIEADLKDLVKELDLSQRVVFMGRLDPQELLPLTCKAGLGISLEEDRGLNYRYALPNKMFDYIQCRIPVLCSNLPEMARIVETYGVGVAIRDRDPQNVARVVRFMLEEREAGAWDSALEKAAQVLCWDLESDQYLALVKASGVL